MRAVRLTLHNIIANRHLVWPIANQDMRTRYSGSVLGIAWAIISPALTILVLWFVMSYGLKVEFPGQVPYYLALLCGFLPWLAFADAVSSGVSAVAGRRFLVKKIAFPLELLPFVPVLSALIIHGGLIALFLLILALHGIFPSRAILALPYLVFALSLLAAAFNMLLSAAAVFVRDLVTAISSILTIWFWATPIVWPITAIPPGIRPYLALNPMVMIVDGYRAILLEQRLPNLLALDQAVFWFMTIGFFVVGASVFQRLKPHFADVL